MGQSQSSKNDRGRDYRIWIYWGGGLGSLIHIYANSEEIMFCLEWGGGDKKEFSDNLHTPTFNLCTCGKRLRYVEVQSYP